MLDSHVHFWNFDSSKSEFDWIEKGMENIRKSFLPEDLLFLTKSEFSDFNCIAVQAAQHWQETLFLLRLATEFEFIKGVVGWIDILKLSDENINILSTSPSKLKGFRHILQAESDGYMLQKNFIQGIKLIGNHGFTYDLLIKSSQLDQAYELVSKCPNQKFTIDHIAKPDIKNGEFDFWVKRISKFKSLENVYCKISGIVTQADWHHFHTKDFNKYLDKVFEIFGTKKVMYGSDWPVCLLTSHYFEVYNITSQYISNLSLTEQHDIMEKNAMKFYNIYN